MAQIIRNPPTMGDDSPPRVRSTSAGGFLFISGQLPVDLSNGALVGGADIYEQTIQTFRNLESVLAEAGSELSSVVRTTVYITDSALTKSMNAAYREVFNPHFPSRTTVVAGLTMLGALIEIDAIAVL